MSTENKNVNNIWDSDLQTDSTVKTVEAPQQNEDILQGNSTPAKENIDWTNIEKIAFRIAFIFFFLMVVPLDIDFYTRWFTTDWSNLHIRDMGGLSGSSFHPIKIVETNKGAGDIGSIAQSNVQFLKFNAESGTFGIASYINWGLAFLIALASGAIWTLIDRKSKNYRVLYYFIIVAVSYSMLIKLNGLTFSKVFPTQMPDLALTQLNTNFGDFTAQKLYWIQLSFVHNYEIFAGLAELLIMTLLFFRKTRFWGAALAVAMIGNIAYVNHAYDGGIHLAASFYVITGLFVMWPYLPQLWNLIVREKDTSLNLYEFPFKEKWQKNLRIAFKVFVFAFYFVLSGYLHWYNYKYDSYKVPSRPGLTDSRGLYQVTEFKLNNKPVAYSPLDSLRWQNVTFEKWSTISYSVFNTFTIHGEAGRGKQVKDVDRAYESAGTGGGRRHFYYEEDPVNKVLTLYNKNKVYKDQQQLLHYERPTNSRIILSGINEYKDSIYVVLDKKEKKYPLYEGRQSNIKAF